MVINKTIRVPERYYIQALIIGGMGPEQVEAELKRWNIPLPIDYMPDIVQDLRKKFPKFFTKEKLVPDDDQLAEANLSPMYYYRFDKAAPDSKDTLGCEGAFRMLEDPLIRKYILAMSLAGLPPLDIELLINARHTQTYESQDFSVFLKFFANFDSWTYPDREFYVDQMQTDAEFKMVLRKAALKGDRHYLVWKLGLGIDPHMSMEQMFADMLADSAFSFKELVRVRPDDAMKFANLAIKLKDRLESSESKKREVTSFAEELRINLTFEKTIGNGTQINDVSEIEVEIPRRGVIAQNLKDLKME